MGVTAFLVRLPGLPQMTRSRGRSFAHGVPGNPFPPLVEAFTVSTQAFARIVFLDKQGRLDYLRVPYRIAVFPQKMPRDGFSARAVTTP
jgi:hypothetical protein